MIAYLLFGIFAIAGLAPFVGVSYSPVLFLIQNGHWGESPKQILFGIIFLISHGGVGFGGLLYVWLKPDGHTDLENAASDEPWLSKTYWASSTIYSNIGSLNTALKYVVRYLGVISIIVFFVVYETVVNRQEYITLLSLIIPFVTLSIYLYSKKLSRQTQNFGRMPLILNPYPGSIGGQLGGTISLVIPKKFTQNTIQKSTVELQCIRYTTSGDDSIQEITWNETMVPAWKTTIEGQKLDFSFDLNDGLSESQPSEKRPYNAWTLFVEITFNDGTTIKCKYGDIPIFRTHQKSTLRNQQAYASQSKKTGQMHDTELDIIMAFKPVGNGGYHLHYPMGRSLLGFFGIIFGLVFIVIGAMIPDIIFNIAFPFAGGCVALGGVYSLVNSLDIHIDPIGVSSKRYVLGFLVRERKITSYDIKEFIWKKSMSTSSSKQNTQYYDIYALANNKKEAILLEGIKGMGQARVAIKRLEKMLKA